MQDPNDPRNSRRMSRPMGKLFLSPSTPGTIAFVVLIAVLVAVVASSRPGCASSGSGPVGLGR